VSPARQTGCAACSLFTIHGMPNRSTAMPNPGDQKVF
jgi:hypothetical protein